MGTPTAPRAAPFLAAALPAALLALPPPTLAAGRPRPEGWAGLAFRDLPGGHVVVSWIYPGPLKGTGLACEGADLARPDLVVALDGVPPAGAQDADARIRAAAPGDTLRLDVRTSRRRGGAIPDTLDVEDAVRRIDVVLDDRADWTGTIGMAPSAWTPPPAPAAPPRLLDPADGTNPLGEAVARLGVGPEVAKLAGVFAKWSRENPDFHSLSHVRAGFEDTFLLPEIARAAASPATQAPADPLAAAVRLFRGSLDAIRRPAPVTHRKPGRRAEAPDPRRPPPGPSPDLRWWVAETRLEEVLRDVEERLDRALGDAATDTALARRALALLRVPRATFYLGGDATREHVAVMRRSMDVDFVALADALEAFGPLVRADRTGLTDWSVPPDHAVPPPAELAEAVSGDVRSAFRVEGVGWIVVGGDGANRYDLAKLAGVLEPGGDDEYVASDLVLGARAVVDLAGNDRYGGTADQGPASALLGAVLVDDRAGDDRYEGALLSTGAAAFGASLLLDRAGTDAYVGGEWSIGAGVYGAGLVMDLGSGSDAYFGEFLCEAVGGPRGLGAIVDEGGNDLYRANGPTPSGYGTPGVFQSFSQGIGFGFRQYAAGGMGLLCDLAGDDRYEAGEFAQGGAYYWSLGVLWDAAGRDLYYGNRYGQGYGVHQALGALLDDGGDDDYWSMTAASQGSGWDIGCGLLLDVAGDDRYRCDELGQGAAAQQAIGLHVDLDGADSKEARGDAVQGAAGGNEYHWAETGAASLGVMLDLGGDADRYVAGRGNDSTWATGAKGAAPTGASPRLGVFVDR
jgi:hypothetical protein